MYRWWQGKVCYWQIHFSSTFPKTPSSLCSSQQGGKKIVLWICWTIMPNPRCETNKFSLAFFFLRNRFCRCGHNAKGNGSPWCPISRKKSLHKSFFFFSVGWISHQHFATYYTRGMCTNICTLYMLVIRWGYFPFLHFLRPFLWIYTRENYFSRRLMLYFWRIFSPSGIFWWGLKDGGEKKFARQMDIFQIKRAENATTTGWNRASLLDRIWFSYFAQKHRFIEDGGNPTGKLAVKLNESLQQQTIATFPTGSRLISLNLSLAFCHSHSCWDCRADFSAFSSFHESLMIVAYCEVEKMET